MIKIKKTKNTASSPSVKETNPAITEAENALASQWKSFESISNGVFERVLQAFIDNKVGEEHFLSVTGYGHDDLGRDVTDKVFAQALQAESALVRVQMVSGTHALSVALNGTLKAGDIMLSLTGSPYDTLEEVIGLREGNPQSLIAKGIHYDSINPFKDYKFQVPQSAEAEEKVRQCRMAYIQRSRGYSLRPTLTISEIEALCQWARSLNPNAIIMVDNCYGEFVEAHEPTAVGADLMAGSLIKNPGGGIVPTGGYIAGNKDLVDQCAYALTAPGIGREGGYTFDLNRIILQGLFLASSMVLDALKGATLGAYLFEQKGYRIFPHWSAQRGDIIQLIELKSAEKLQRFCQHIQSNSPISANVRPEAATVPGYGDKVVMAGGTFIQGATLELSADGPLREPYAVFLQGGLVYAHSRLTLGKLIQNF